MKSNWKTVTIGDFLSHRKGYAFKSNQYKKKGHKIARVSDFTQRSIDIDSCICIDEKQVDQFSDYALKVGDVVIATVGSWPTNPASVVGRAIRIPDESNGLLLNQNAVRLRSKGNLSQKFLFYLLSSDHYQNFIVSRAQGSASQASIKLSDIFSYQTLIPPLSEQEAIASLIGGLDEKIENNQQINKTLDEMAHTIFKSWFVDFDPIHAKTSDNVPAHMDEETATLFPSSFGDNGLPVGWSVKTLSDLIMVKRGKTITKSKTKEGTIPVVAGGLEPAYFHNQSNVDSPVITISASGANAGFTRLYYENIWASDCSYISKQQTDAIYFWFVFLKTNQKKIYHMQQGAAQPHIYPSDLMRLELVYPNKKLIQHFEKLITPYFEKISIAHKESKTLAKLRDTLLPKLMSGEIRVNDAEREVESIV